MKQLQANNLQQAKAELEKIKKGLSEGLNENIPKSEKNYFHVILTKIVTKVGQVENAITMTVVPYGKNQFKKIAKNFSFLGYDHAIILHNPNLNEDEKEVIVPDFVKAKTEQEIREEMQAEFDAKLEAETEKRLEAYKAEQVEQEVAPSSSETEEDEDEEADELDSEERKEGFEVVKNGQVEDLDNYAEKVGVEPYSKDANKPAKKKAIRAFLKATKPQA